MKIIQIWNRFKPKRLPTTGFLVLELRPESPGSAVRLTIANDSYALTTTDVLPNWAEYSGRSSLRR